MQEHCALPALFDSARKVPQQHAHSNGFQASLLSKTDEMVEEWNVNMKVTHQRESKQCVVCGHTIVQTTAFIHIRYSQ